MNECRSGGNNCHECNNLPGGYECVCRDGYYHSAAAATCYGENALPGLGIAIYIYQG